MFVTDGLNGGSISGLKMVNSPMWFNLISNSTDLLISDFDMDVQVENPSYPAHVRACKCVPTSAG